MHALPAPRGSRHMYALREPGLAGGDARTCVARTPSHLPCSVACNSALPRLRALLHASSCTHAALTLTLTLIPRHLRPTAQVCVCAVDFESSAGFRVGLRVRVVVACN